MDPEFIHLLERLLESNNSVRRDAESQLQAVLADPFRALSLLALAIDASPALQIKELATVLFRRYSVRSHNGEDEPMLSKLTSEQLEQCKAIILASFESDHVDSVRHKIADAVSDIAVWQSLGLADDDTLPSTMEYWPQLGHALWAAASAPSLSRRNAALRVLRDVPRVFGTHMVTYQHEIKALVAASLDPSHGSMDLLGTASGVVAAFVLDSDDKTVRDLFLEFVPQLLRIVQHASDLLNEECANEILGTLVTLATNVPKQLRPYLPDIVEVAIKVFLNEELDDRIRKSSAELLVTLAEQAPGMVRKFPNFIAQVLAAVMQVMTHVEDEEDWGFRTTEATLDDEDMCLFGEEFLDRLGSCVKGKSLVPAFIQISSAMLQDKSWQPQNAVLSGLAALAESCASALHPYLSGIMPVVLAGTSDPHPRVRHAACTSIGHFSEDFCDEQDADGNTTLLGFVNTYHASIVPALLEVMKDIAHPRVSAIAAAAFVDFSMACPKDVLQQYLSDIVGGLVALLQHPVPFLQEQALQTVACLAQEGEELFQPFAPIIVPVLKQAIYTMRSPATYGVWAKALQCFSYICCAMGRDKIIMDAIEVLEFIRVNYGEFVSQDDAQKSLLLLSWGLMCEVLAEDFAPYAALQLPLLLHMLQLQPQLKPISDENDTRPGDDDADEWEEVEIGSVMFKVNTSILQDIAEATQLLCGYLKHMKAGSVSLLPKITPTLVNMLSFYYHDGVRENAALAMPLILTVARDNLGKDETESYARGVIPKLSAAIHQEEGIEIMATQIDALRECSEILGQIGVAMTEAELSQLSVALVIQLQDLNARSMVRLENKSSDEDFDEETQESLDEEERADEGLLFSIINLIHELFVKFSVHLLPYFNQWVHLFVSMLSIEHPAYHRKSACCVFDDLLEHAAEQAEQYHEMFLEQFLQCILDKNPECRQAAAYGCGVMAQIGREPYASISQGTLPALFQAAHTGSRRKFYEGNSIDNCVSAIGKIIRHFEGVDGFDKLVTEWLHLLPLTHDIAEAKLACQIMCELLQHHDRHVYLTRPDNVAQIVRMLVVSSSQHVELRALATHHLTAMQQYVPAESQQQAWAVLDADTTRGALELLQGSQ